MVLERPELEVDVIEVDGCFKIEFNTAILGLQIMKELDSDISTEGKVQKENDEQRNKLRRLEKTVKFDLAKYMDFVVVRGSE